VACRNTTHPEADAQGAGDCDLAGAMDVWKHRNDCVFEGVQPETRDLCAKIKEEAKT
jgi:hypothetical protein